MSESETRRDVGFFVCDVQDRPGRCLFACADTYGGMYDKMYVMCMNSMAGSRFWTKIRHGPKVTFDPSVRIQCLSTSALREGGFPFMEAGNLLDNLTYHTKK